MIKCGVFDSLGVSRSALVACYENILDSEHEKNRNNVSGQMDLFSMASAGGGVTDGYKYPDLAEYPLKELLILEKESSGMYFSGHMIDNYSKHISSLGLDRISDILEDTRDESESPNPKYKDRQNVKIAGIITDKRTKAVKNGDTMAFIKLEDRFAEIEVIVFARQYSKCSSELYGENAVMICGSISVEEGEDSKILLSSIEPLLTNHDFEERYKSANPPRIFVKAANLSDTRIQRITKLALLNPGECDVVIYDEGSKKYSALRGTKLASTDKVIGRLREIFGEQNVVIK